MSFFNYQEVPEDRLKMAVETFRLPVDNIRYTKEENYSFDISRTVNRQFSAYFYAEIKIIRIHPMNLIKL